MKNIVLLILTILPVFPVRSEININPASLAFDSTDFRAVKSPDGEIIYEYISVVETLVSPEEERQITPKEQPQPLRSASEEPTQHSPALVGVLIDNTKAVGEINIESTVSNGIVMHNVPIEMASSPGLQPTISIAYNSGSLTSGALGYGWTLGGVSSISASVPNYYYDGPNYSSPKLDKTGAFSLDGVRLIKLSETPTQITYQTEQGNIKVISYIPSRNYRFEVFYPNGSKGTFGYQLSSRSMSKIVYPMTRLEDQRGYFISYSYAENSNVSYLERAEYGKDNHIIGSIRFTYQSVENTKTAYFSGRQIQYDRLLESIQTYHQSNLLFTYHLHYEQKDHHLLSRISCTSGTEELNPLVFSYGSEHERRPYFSKGMALLYKYFKNANTANLVLNKGKFDQLSVNDGMIAYPDVERFGITTRKGNDYAYGSRYSSEQNLLVYKNLGDYHCSPEIVQAGRGFQHFLPVDINGDGSDELVRVNYWLENRNEANLNITTYDKDMKTRNTSFLLEGTFGEGKLVSAVPRTFLTGDFNGDGKAELLAISGNKMPKGETRGWSRTTMVNLETRSIIYNQTPFLYDFFNDCLFAFDFDGDNRTDVCLINSSGIYIYAFRNGSFAQVVSARDITSTSLQNKQLLVGDVNGDGMIDILLTPVKSTHRATRSPDLKWTLLTSTGTGFLKKTFSYHAYYDDYKYLLQDVNGDCLPDLLVKRGETISLYLNKDGQFNATPEAANLQVESNAHFITGVVSGGYYRGRPSHVLSIMDATVTPITFSRNDAFESLLTRVTNSLGVMSRYDYSNLANLDSYRHSSSTVNFPFNKMFINMHLVARVQTYAGYDMLSSQSYFYQDAVFHRQGRGFQGFQKITLQDDFSRTNRELEYDTQNFGTLKTIETPTISSSFTYSVYVASNKIADVLLKHRYDFEKLKKQSIRTYYHYDRYGYVTSEEVFQEDDLSSMRTNFQYDNYTTLSNYFLGELTNKEVTKTSFGESTVSKEVFAYNTNHLPLSRKQLVDSNQVSEESFRYDAQNNLEKVESRQYNASSWLSKTMEYDRFGRIVRETDPLGLSTEYYYNTKGLLFSTKNHKGQETNYTYNDFGQLTKTTFPDGRVKIRSAYWYEQVSSTEFPIHQPEELILSEALAEGGEIKACKSVILQSGFSFQASPGNSLLLKTDANTCASPPQGAVLTYMVTEEVTGSPAVKTYYDAIGREVRKSQMRFDGIYMNVDTQYDQKGRISKMSIPFKNGSFPLWNVYSYDDYDRITKITHSTGKEDLYSYDGRTVTTVIDGISRKKTYDELGQLILAEDTASSISYQYFPNGNPYSITTAFRDESSEVLTYPLLQELLIEIAGLTGVPYRALTRTTRLDEDLQISINEYLHKVHFLIWIITERYGVLLSESDFSNVVVIDDLNTLIAERIGVEAICKVEETTTSFEYDNYGRQTKIIDPSAGTKTYAYDQAGNLWQETDANGKTTTMLYDRYNRLVKKSSPELTADYVYDGYGRLVSESSDNGTSLHLDYDEFDRVITEKELAGENEWLKKECRYSGNVLSSASYSNARGTIATERYAYSRGYHVETDLEGHGSVWKLKSEDSQGNVTGITTGALSRTYRYDDYGLPVSREVKGNYGVILSHSYDFDRTTGNLNYRRDNLRGKTETFMYDELNRLTGVNGAEMYTYDATGNITSSSEVGVFEYNHPSKPYAVTSALPSSQNSIPLREQRVNYTSFMRPSDITENGLTARFAYNASGDRLKMTMEQSGSVSSSRYYIGGQYEKETTGGNTKERLYLGGDAYSAPLVYQNEGNGWKVYYICRDYLGNIVQVTNSSGMSLQELSFDAWGRLRDPDTHAVYATGQEPALFLNRGFTGHEHLTAFGLINMNARLYDPMLGRFLSPDPYVQAPEWAQNLNRYSYGLNNPMRYVDRDGEFIFGYTSGFFRGLFSGKNPFKEGWKGGVNEVKIWGGLFTSDSNKNFGGKLWEILSRFTWQLPQTIFGLGFSNISNYAGQVDKVDYWGGATVLSGNFWGQGDGSAITLGSYINGGRNLKADPHNSLFQHEYGHYLQSQSMGWAYLPRIGMPSLMSADGTGNHKYQPFEQDANARAFNYFNKNVDGFYQTEAEYNMNRIGGDMVGWDFWQNPLDVNHIGSSSRGRYYDYHNPAHQDLINSLSLKAKWYDHFDPFGLYIGIGNGLYYRKNRIK